MPVLTWILAAAVFFFGVFPLLILPLILYVVLLVRTSKKKWSRACPFPDDEEYVRMFEEGENWRKTFKDAEKDVCVQSDGFRICGEFYDFGGTSCVMIVPGRADPLTYSCYYADVYRRSGMNVFVYDTRSHGLSDGKVNAVGFREYRDILTLSRYLHDELHQERIVLHGVCIGASASLFALTDETCPVYLCALVTEGMYTTFSDLFRNHLRVRGHRASPTVQVFAFYAFLFSRARILSDGPIARIKRLKRPILIFHSYQDTFSLPKYAEMLYNECTSKKQLVWFEEGAHSRIRFHSPEKYDGAIADFLKEHLFLDEKTQ